MLEVGVKDNSQVQKGQLLFRIDPEPYELAVRAQRGQSPSLQGADVSVADVAAAHAQIQKQRADLHASRAINKIVTDLVDKNALARTQEIRSTSDVGKTQADLARAQADLRKAEASLGAPGLRNPKVRQALAALEQARLDLRNTRVVAPAAGTVTNLRLAAGQYVAPGNLSSASWKAVRDGFPLTCGRTSWATYSPARMLPWPWTFGPASSSTGRFTA